MRQGRRRIQRVLIENFQSHSRSELTFGQGLNAILGPSDNGKSAVIRAIRWALYSEPRGTEFVRFGARECRVTLTMSDGVEIVRELLVNKAGTGGRNRYLLRRPGQEEQVFEGFGTEVPLEIIKAHGMPPIVLDKDKRVMLNLGSQLEAPFLLAETGSLRARAVGRLLGVHVVDAADRGAQRDLKERRREAKALQERVDSYEAKLQPFADVPEEEARLAEAERLMAVARSAVDRRQRLQVLQGRWTAVTGERTEIKAALSPLQGVEEAEALHQQALTLQQRFRSLQSLYAERARTRGEIRLCRESMDRLERVEILGSMLQTAETQFARVTRLVAYRDRLEAVREQTGRGQLLLDRLGALDQLEPLAASARVAADRLRALRHSAARYLALAGEQSSLRVSIQGLEGLPEAALLAEQIRTQTERLARLRTLARNHQEQRAAGARVAAELNVLAKVEPAEQATSQVQVQLDRLHQLKAVATRWQEVVDRLAKGQLLLAEVDAELGHQLQGYAKVLREHETCPTCRQRVEAARIPEIIRQIAAE